jgi:hypothetical protein
MHGSMNIKLHIKLAAQLHIELRLKRHGAVHSLF